MTLAAGMVDRLFIDLAMPELVSNPFLLELGEGMTDIGQHALVNARPIYQVRPASPARPTATPTTLLLLLHKTVQVILALRMSTGNLQRGRLGPDGFIGR